MHQTRSFFDQCKQTFTYFLSLPQLFYFICIGACFVLFESYRDEILKYVISPDLFNGLATSAQVQQYYAVVAVFGLVIQGAIVYVLSYSLLGVNSRSLTHHLKSFVEFMAYCFCLWFLVDPAICALCTDMCGLGFGTFAWEVRLLLFDMLYFWGATYLYGQLQFDRGIWEGVQATMSLWLEHFFVLFGFSLMVMWGMSSYGMIISYFNQWLFASVQLTISFVMLCVQWIFFASLYRYIIDNKQLNQTIFTFSDNRA